MDFDFREDQKKNKNARTQQFVEDASRIIHQHLDRYEDLRCEDQNLRDKNCDSILTRYK